MASLSLGAATQVWLAGCNRGFLGTARRRSIAAMLPVIAAAEAPAHLGPGLSLLAALVVFGGLLAFVVEALVRAAGDERLAKKGEASGLEGGAALAVGRAVVLGWVELAPEESVAMRVEVDQRGSESESSGSYSFAWTEVDRRVTMRPFYLRHASGARVRVEPGAWTYLVDAMDGIVVVDSAHRTRAAELSSDEQVYAVGELSRGHDPGLAPSDYRNAAHGWLMRARPGEDLLLSSEPLQQRFLRRAGAHYQVAVVAAVLAVGVFALFAPYVARLLLGRDTTAVVQELRSDSDDEGATTYSLMVRAAVGPVVEVDAPYDVYAVAHVGDAVPVRYVAAWAWATALGHGATLDGFALLALAVLAVMFGVRYAVRRSAAKWYEAALVDKGVGKLAEHRKSTSM